MTRTPIPDDEVMYTVIGVRVSRLKGENRSVWRGVQLDHSLHGERTIDEIRRLVVHVFNVYNHSLIVRVCKHKIRNYKNFYFYLFHFFFFLNRVRNNKAGRE